MNPPQPRRDPPHDPLRQPALLPVPHDQARPQQHAMREPQLADRLLQLALHLGVRHGRLRVRPRRRDQHVRRAAGRARRPRQLQVQVQVDLALVVDPAGRCARRAQRGEEDLRRGAGREGAGPGARVGQLQRVQLRARGRVGQLAAGVGLDGGDGGVGEEVGEDVRALGFRVSWGMGGGRMGWTYD